METPTKTSTETAKIYQVVNWESHFEGAKTKTYNNKTTCSMPTKHGLGYRKLVRNENGAALFGAWCSLIQLLSRHPKERQGYCTDTGQTQGEPYTDADLEMMTDIPKDVFSRLFEITQTIGWVRVIEAKDTTGIPDGYHDHSQYPLNLDLDSDLDLDLDSKEKAVPIKKAMQSLSGKRQEALNLWMDHCIEIGRPLKATSFALLVNEWKDISDARFLSAVKYSVRKNYKGIYEEGANNGKEKKIRAGL